MTVVVAVICALHCNCDSVKVVSYLVAIAAMAIAVVVASAAVVVDIIVTVSVVVICVDTEVAAGGTTNGRGLLQFNKFVFSLGYEIQPGMCNVALMQGGVYVLRRVCICVCV